MLLAFKHSGNFNNTERFLKRNQRLDLYRKLKPYGEEGVRALASATPIDSGETASSWNYEIRINQGSVSLIWTNSNIVGKDIPVAILIQYGHATRNGGFVQGRDYINPTLRPIFDRITDAIWREVTS